MPPWPTELQASHPPKDPSNVLQISLVFKLLHFIIYILFIFTSEACSWKVSLDTSIRTTVRAVIALSTCSMSKPRSRSVPLQHTLMEAASASRMQGRFSDSEERW